MALGGLLRQQWTIVKSEQPNYEHDYDHDYDHEHEFSAKPLKPLGSIIHHSSFIIAFLRGL